MSIVLEKIAKKVLTSVAKLCYNFNWEGGKMEWKYFPQ